MKATVKTKILIVDDHSLMRMGLRTMLGIQPDMTVVGEAGNGHQAVDLVEKVQPDVVIMDLMMPEMNGADATKKILAVRPETKIIIFTSFGSSVEMLQAIRNGAVGVQLKEDPEANLIKAIHAVLKGETRIPDVLKNQAAETTETAPLTSKQSEILHAASRGLTNKEIATLFGISDIGVQKHLKLIFAKIGAANRSEAIAIALRRHLLKI